MALARNTNPLKAPWPPGVDYRVVDGGKLGLIGQLRPGAELPPDVYAKLQRDICSRAPAASACHRN